MISAIDPGLFRAGLGPSQLAAYHIPPQPALARVRGCAETVDLIEHFGVLGQLKPLSRDFLKLLLIDQVNHRRRERVAFCRFPTIVLSEVLMLPIQSDGYKFLES